jgi:transcriptional regulator with XRE-family HTH domain
MDFSEVVCCGMKQSAPRPSGLPSRIQFLADLAGSILGLSEITGLSRKSLGEWLAGKREPSPYALKKIVVTLGVDQEWLLYGTGAEPRSITAGMVKTAAVPLTDSTSDSQSILSAGVDWLKFHLGLNASNLLLVHTQDDEMAPTIFRGEPVLARIGGTPGHSWRLFVVRNEGVVMVRYAREEENNSITLRSENIESSGLWLGENGGLKFLGEVVWYGTKVQPYAPARSRVQSLPGQTPMRRRVP